MSAQDERVQGIVTRKKILEFLKNYIDENGYSPSYGDIRNAIGVKSLSTVQHHIEILEKEGMLKKHDKARSIVIFIDPPENPYGVF